MKEETRKKISKALKGRPSPLKGRPSPLKGRPSPLKGRPSPLKGRPSPHKGKHYSDEEKKRLYGTRKGRQGRPGYWKGRFRENSPNWRGGVTPYLQGTLFNELQQCIRDRDHNKCQNPYCSGRYKSLETHHIDSNTKNNDPRNLITLCKSCHEKANKSKYRWQRLLRRIV